MLIEVIRCVWPLLVASVVFAQPQPKLEFEVASVKSVTEHIPGAPIGCTGGPGSTDPARFTCQFVTPTILIYRAYNLTPLQVVAPEWSTSARFDIVATAPAGATKEQIPEMLQNLLADRFHLTTHHEAKEVGQYQLSVAKTGPKLKLAGEKSEGPQPMAFLGRRPDGTHLTFPRMTTKSLAGMLQNETQTPVVDLTGLTDEYSIALVWCPDDGVRVCDASPSLASALQEQLGLHLEMKKALFDRLVVDHIDKTPTNN